MDFEIDPPEESLRYILYQRSDGFRLTKGRIARFLRRRVFPIIPMHRTLAILESRVWRDETIATFNRDMRSEFETMAPHLPARGRRILDIGCGVAGLDVLLARRFAADAPEILLIDRTQIDPSVDATFEKRGTFYSSLEVARTMLEANGVAADQITTQTATDDSKVAADGPFDVVLSTLSWGFHFPVSSYLPEVLRVVADDGVVFLDVRKTNIDGLALLRAYFRDVDVIHERKKLYRCKLTGPIRAGAGAR